MPSANASFALPVYSARSAVTSLLTNVGSAWYSAWNRSGALPVLAAVRTLVTSSSPCDCLLTVTRTSGWLAFHLSTTFSTLVAQVQNVSSTFPPSAPDPPDEQPDNRATTRTAPA